MHTSDVCQGSSEMLHQNKPKNNENDASQQKQVCRLTDLLKRGNIFQPEI